MTLSREMALGILALGLAVVLVWLGWERMRPRPLDDRRLDGAPAPRPAEFGRPRR